MKEKILLKWQAKPKAGFAGLRNLPKRNLTIMALMIFILIFSFLSLYLTKNTNSIIIGAIFVFIIFLIVVITSLFPGTGEYCITEEGISRGLVGRSGKVGPISQIMIKHSKFQSRMGGSVSAGDRMFMPFSAITSYYVKDNKVIINSKRLNPSIVLVANENLNQITSILEKKGIKRENP